MRLRALLATLSCVLSLLLTAKAQFADPMTRLGNERGNTSIAGSLLGADGMPVSDVRIEVRDAITGSVMGTTVSRANGAFEMSNLPAGSYEVVAQCQGVEARQMVSANGSLSRVDLQFNQPVQGFSSSTSKVSVAQLKVPQKARDRYNKAEQAFAKGKFDQAEKAVGESLAIYAANPEALTLRGILEIQKNNTADAMGDFQAAINLDPGYELAYTAMGSVYNSEGKFDDAARTTERAVAIAPHAWQGYFEMAKAFIGKGMYDRALQVANKAQTLGAGSFAGLHLIKACAMVPLKLYKDATVELQAFLSHPPQGQNTEPIKQMLAQVQAAETAAVNNEPVGMSLMH